MRLRPLGLAFVLIAGCYSGGLSCSEVPAAPQCHTARDCARARTTPEKSCWGDVCENGLCAQLPLDGLQADDKKNDCASPVCKQGELVHIADSSDAPPVAECRTVHCVSDGSGPEESYAPDGTTCSIGYCISGTCEDDFPPQDKTTGLPCANDDDCDKTANGLAHCTAFLYPAGPLNPTPICIQADSADVCMPTDAGMVRLCDGARGLCVKSGDRPATCEAMCILGADGSWEKSCAGKNGCNLQQVETDATTGKTRLFGTCQGGCISDADCPAGGLCDPGSRECMRACTVDDDCRKTWPGAPANWRCDVARGACAFVYTKKLGDPCTTTDECICSIAAGAAAGTCVTKCRDGDDCGAGFTCDALVPASTFTFVTQPFQLLGSCLRNCSTDADCPSGTDPICALSAGLTQKTCRPK
ncbi:MAG: hypothetical protein ACXVEE_34460 [Polyangiales bacterium]